MTKPLVNRSTMRSPESVPRQMPRNSVRAELAAAVRAVNAAYHRLPVEARDRIDLAFDPLEAEVDAAIAARDRDRAIDAINAWRRWQLDHIEGAS